MGNPTRLTDGRGNTTWSTYTAWNQPEDLLEPATDAHPAEDDRRWRTRYDAAGSPVEQRQPGGIVVARDFDRLGRLVGESGSGPGVPAASRSFGYDLAGRRTSASHPGGQVVFAYDDRSLLTAAAAPTGDSSFDYDAAGRLLSRSDGAGTASFTWTARDELDTATDPLTGVTRDYTWDDAGQLTTVAHSPGGAVRTYGYDEAGRLVDDALRTADGTLSMQEAYAYNADDNVVSQTTTLPPNAAATTNIFGYDRAGRLSTWARPGLPTVEFGWDAANNRTSAGASSWTYDQRNRMVAGSDGTSAWSPRGTLASVTSAVDATSYVFDALGRLVDYDGQATYTYDALDRVATRNQVPFAYAGTEIDPVSDGAATYARTPGGDLLAVADAAGAHVVGRNRHGDVTHLLGGDGAVAGSRLYDPFGAPLATAGVALPAAGYQGDWTDPASGKVWMGARWYDGEDAAFASRDTVRGDLNSPISLNRYTYAFGDPLSYFDPDGHWPKLLDNAVKAVGNKAKKALRVAARVVAAPVRFQVAVLTTTASKAASAVVRHVETGRKFVAGIKVGGVRLGEYGAAVAVSTRGAARGVANLAKGVTRPVTDPLGTARDARKTYRESGGGLSGALHALNETFNPAVSLLHAGDAYLSAWKAGDYEAMSEAGIGLTASGAATMAVGAGGLAAVKSAARPKPRPCNSFVADTAVLMANGSRKAIEDVDLGDMVAAEDPESGQDGPRMVTALITGHGDKRLVDITVDGQTVTATDGHPFWVENRRRWVRADDVVAGDVLLDATGRARSVQQVKIRNLADQTVHNLTVDGLHTYFVLAGNTALLTHNSSSCDIGSPDGPGDAHGSASPASPTNSGQAVASEILPKPSVVNAKLQNVVNDLYKGTTNRNRVGMGTTADAVRNERATGLPTGGTFHSQKAQQYSSALERLLKQNLSDHDRLVARSLLDDLRDAVGGTP